MNELAKVLLADDEGHIRILLKNVVSKLDAEVVAQATNGDEAVTLFEEHRPDLVLLDINMPVKTGVEALGEIMEIDPAAKVIMLTAMDQESAATQAIRRGAKDFLGKPAPPARILAALQHVLR